MQMNYHKIINMKKLLILLGFLTFYCSIFGQYTGNKLPSGLTVSNTVDSADYTIIQKNGETIVKAVRMDTLKAYFSAGIIESIEPLDSVSGSTGQFIISDGSGWLAPVSAKYEGNDAYTFGQRLSGAIGSGSIVLGRGRATAARSFTINGITASGVDAISMNGSTVSGTSSIGINGSNVSGKNSAGINGAIVSGDRSTAINQGTASGDNSFAVGNGTVASGNYSTAWDSGIASGDHSTAWNDGVASGNNSTAWNEGSAFRDNSTSWNGGVASGDNSTSWNGGSASGDNSTAWGSGISQSFLETSFGQYIDTATTKTTDLWVVTDRLLTIGNGTSGSPSNALVMLKNGNTTVNGNWTFSDTIMADEGFIKNKAHGFYAFEDSTVLISLTDDTWAQVTNCSNNLFTAVQDGAGFTISGDTIYFTQPSIAGTTPHIVFHYGVDGYGSLNNDFECRIFNVSNNAGVMRKSEKSGEGSANRISLGTTAYDNQTTFGDAYIIQVRNTTNNDDFTVENGSIYLEVSHY